MSTFPFVFGENISIPEFAGPLVGPAFVEDREGGSEGRDEAEWKEEERIFGRGAGE